MTKPFMYMIAFYICAIFTVVLIDSNPPLSKEIDA